MDNNYLLASLHQRQRSLTLNSQLYDRWTSGNTTSSRIGLTINESFYNSNTSKFDWVRRFGTHPRVVCGSASGAIIYVADVGEGKVLAASCAHYPSTSCNDEDEDDDLLEGEDNFALYYIFYMETMMAVEYSQWQ